MALRASDIGGRVFSANTIMGVFEGAANRTKIVATDAGGDGDLLASLLCDLHHWATANDLDWDLVNIEASDRYREDTGGPAY